MGKRDKRWKEPRKPKKDTKRVTAAEVLPSPVTVEVIKRKRKEVEGE